MKKLEVNQMENLQGGRCWDFNIKYRDFDILVHDCDAKDRWHWFWED